MYYMQTYTNNMAGASAGVAVVGGGGGGGECLGLARSCGGTARARYCPPPLRYLSTHYTKAPTKLTHPLS